MTCIPKLKGMISSVASTLDMTNILFLAAVPMALTGFTFVSRFWSQPAAPKHSFPLSNEAMFAAGAAKAVGRARSRYGIALDGSLESIGKVEQVLANLHQEYKVAPECFDLRSLSFVFGSYIGETLRQNFSGCEWETSNSLGRDSSFALYWGKEVCYPVEWCLQRMREGASEDICTKVEFTRFAATGHVPVRARAAAAAAC